MDKDQLMHEIGSKLVNDIGSRKKNWKHLVSVGTIADGTSEMTGIVYNRDGTYEPGSPRDFEVFRLLDELREAMAKADKKSPWLTCLIRIDRESGEIAVEFEYDHAERWKISPGNIKKRAEELRPVPS